MVIVAVAEKKIYENGKGDNSIWSILPRVKFIQGYSASFQDFNKSLMVTPLLPEKFTIRRNFTFILDKISLKSPYLRTFFGGGG